MQRANIGAPFTARCATRQSSVDDAWCSTRGHLHPCWMGNAIDQSHARPALQPVPLGAAEFCSRSASQWCTWHWFSILNNALRRSKNDLLADEPEGRVRASFHSRSMKKGIIQDSPPTHRKPQSLHSQQRCIFLYQAGFE